MMRISPACWPPHERGRAQFHERDRSVQAHEFWRWQVGLFMSAVNVDLGLETSQRGLIGRRDACS